MSETTFVYQVRVIDEDTVGIYSTAINAYNKIKDMEKEAMEVGELTSVKIEYTDSSECDSASFRYRISKAGYVDLIISFPDGYPSLYIQVTRFALDQN